MPTTWRSEIATPFGWKAASAVATFGRGRTAIASLRAAAAIGAAGIAAAPATGAEPTMTSARIATAVAAMRVRIATRVEEAVRALSVPRRVHRGCVYRDGGTTRALAI